MNTQKLLSITVTTVSLVFAGGVVAAEMLTQKLEATSVVDLTHRMYDEMAFWPGGVPFKKTRLVDYDQGYQLHKFEMGENTGTHVDAPSHFIKGNKTIDELTFSELVVPAVVIDVQDKVVGNPSSIPSFFGVFLACSYDAKHVLEGGLFK